MVLLAEVDDSAVSGSSCSHSGVDEIGSAVDFYGNITRFPAIGPGEILEPDLTRLPVEFEFQIAVEEPLLVLWVEATTPTVFCRSEKFSQELPVGSPEGYAFRPVVVFYYPKLVSHIDVH